MKRLAIVLGTLIVTVVGVQPAFAAFPGGNGRIAYYVFNAVPTAIRTIDPSAPEDDVRFAPDNHHQIDPEWSADGTQMLYLRLSVNGSGGSIVTANADGSNRQVVVSRSDLPGGPFVPAWSPDGSQIVFCLATPAGALRVYVVGVDGTGLQKISGTHDDCDPSWSPDGTRIAVDSDVPGKAVVIVTMDPDGSQRQKVVAAGRNFWPDWSPDGSRLVFIREVTGNKELFVMSATGGSRTRLTATPRRTEYTPAWSPMGGRIVFSRTSRGPLSPADLWRISPDGSSETRLTHTKSRDEFAPDWQPI